MDAASPRGAQSLSRAVSVLRVVAAAPTQGARLADLVKGTGLSKATAHRLAAALVHEGLLAYDPASRYYGLGQWMPEVARAGGRPAAWPKPITPPTRACTSGRNTAGMRLLSPICSATGICPASARIRP